MRHATKLIPFLLLAAAALNAQDELAQYQTWMKSAAGATNAAKAAVTAKDNSAVAENAKKLSESFDQIAKFWEKRHKEDAMKLAETARDAGKSLASATSPEDQMAAIQKVGGTCRSCHQVYRDGSNFKN
jgi:cytochrome c556